MPTQFSEMDDHPWITEMVECSVFNTPPGYWTDDSSPSMCIMDSYIRKDGYDLKDIADTFLKWLNDGYLSSMEGVAFDIGMATEESIAAYEFTGSLVNGTEESQGNGSIMRFSPSCFLAQKEDDPAKVMHEISDFTHNSSWVREVADRFAGIICEHLAGHRTVEISMYRQRNEIDNSGLAVSTLEAALWAFNTTAIFGEGMIAAVNLGGDSDSIGAVFGQLAGSYYGYSAIPRRWIEKVEDWEKVDTLIDDFLEMVGVCENDNEKTND